MKEKRRIAFYLPKSIPISNLKLSEAFSNQFNSYQTDIINIEITFKKQIVVLMLNAFHTLTCYGIGILKGKRKLTNAFWRTPYIFKQVKALAQKKHRANNYAFTFQVQSLFDCSVAGVPHFVYTDHTHLANLNYPSFDPARLFPLEWIDLEKTIYNNATLVFVRSSNIKRSLEQQYQLPSNKIQRVYAGRNAEIKHVSTDKSRYQRQSILFVGIDWKRKGGPVLIEAFRIIQKNHPNATLTVVGCKPDTRMAGVHEKGRVPLEKLVDYYNAASIFCMPTVEEPFGIAFLEAMAAGLPIIGTQVGAIPDFVSEETNGFMVEPNDASALAIALAKLLGDAGRCQQFGLSSLEIVNKNYSWQSVCEKLQNHIHTVVEKTGSLE